MIPAYAFFEKCDVCDKWVRNMNDHLWEEVIKEREKKLEK